MEQKGSILIVDDDKSVLTVTKKLLAAEGHIVFECNDGNNAVNAFKTVDFDAVLSDIRMPGITGIEVMEAIHEISPETPVILFTAYADLDTAIDAIKKEAFDFIIKPYDPDVLIKAIDKALMFKRLRRLENDYKSKLETEVKEKTEFLFRQSEELRLSRDKAMEASRLKSEFISTINHELRTPLNGIIGLSDLLIDMDLPVAAKKYIQMITKCAGDLNRVMTNILEMSVLYSSNIQLQKLKFSPADIVVTVKREFLDRASECGIKLTCELQQDLPDALLGDAPRVEQVLSELVDNAIKFSGHGDITVKISLKEHLDDRTTLDFSVTDSGKAIPAHAAVCIFESFRQGDGSLTRKHGGMGLGLAIAKRLVELMGGEIRLETLGETGNSFSFSLSFYRL